jgi:hypothetical protein
VFERLTPVVALDLFAAALPLLNLKGHPGAAVEALTTGWRSKFRFEPPYDHPHMVGEVKTIQKTAFWEVTALNWHGRT